MAVVWIHVFAVFAAVASHNAALALKVVSDVVRPEIDVYDSASENLEGGDDQGINNGQVLDLRQYTKVWKKLAANEIDTVDIATNVSIVLGIPTYAAMSEYREVMENTWMKRPGLCNLLTGKGVPRGPIPGCGVYLVWFYSMLGDESDAARNEIHFNFSTPKIQYGAVYEFFRWASRRVPWATHVGKIDMDTYPWLGGPTQKLARMMPHDKRPYYHVYGSCATECRRWCEFPVDLAPHCRKRCEYFQGALYIISRDLALSISESDGWWHNNSFDGRFHSEDREIGRAIRLWSNTTEQCYNYAEPNHLKPVEYRHIRKPGPEPAKPDAPPKVPWDMKKDWHRCPGNKPAKR